MKSFFKASASAIAKLSDHVITLWSEFTGVKVVAIATLTLSGLVLGMRHLGGLEPLELLAFDQMMRLRPDLGQDPRLLVVGITEQDIRRQKRVFQSDLVVAELLKKLQQYQPRVIGLDLYRDIPFEPGRRELVAELQQPNVIAIRNIDDIYGTPAPPEITAERVGFNDFPIDPDGVLRRNTLFADSENNSVLFSFSLQVALAYLQGEGISPQASEINNYLQLNKAVFVPLKDNSGPYKTNYGGYEVMLNYRGVDVARQVTLSQVLDGKIEPQWVKDKIVLIGSTAPSLKDNFATPYSPGLKQNYKMAGVIVHAQMVSQLLDAAKGDRPLFWFWPEWAQKLWIVGWVLVAGILAWWLRHPLVLSLGVGVSVVILFGTSFYLFSQQGWIPLSAPALGFLLTTGLVITYRSYEAQQQQQMVMKLLGQNTSPEIAIALWKGRSSLLKSGKLPGVKLTATMMFTDLRNFSTISEQMPPEALLEFLNELLDVITHEVLVRQGVINKFTGDGIMAAFGVPIDSAHKPDEISKDAQRAVDCALAMSEALKKLNVMWQSRGLQPIQMRVGIYTGQVVVGSLGGKDRLEYGIIGDSVNIASRLESSAKERQPSHCRILIGHETLVHLEDQFVVESWGAMELKGKNQMVDVYLVMDRKPQGEKGEY